MSPSALAANSSSCLSGRSAIWKSQSTPESFLTVRTTCADLWSGENCTSRISRMHMIAITESLLGSHCTLLIASVCLSLTAFGFCGSPPGESATV